MLLEGAGGQRDKGTGVARVRFLDTTIQMRKVCCLVTFFESYIYLAKIRFSFLQKAWIFRLQFGTKSDGHRSARCKRPFVASVVLLPV